MLNGYHQAGLKLTPTEQLLYDALGDGKPHYPLDLMEMMDELAVRADLHNHISRLRKKLNTVGEDIVCQLTGKIVAYRRVL
jgi:hypothetical protein